MFLYPARDWHVHEMVFGFLPCVMTGFLLTAIPNWTERPPMRGVSLMLLWVLWLVGRIAIAASWFTPLASVIIDSAFLVVVAGIVWRQSLTKLGDLRRLTWLVTGKGHSIDARFPVVHIQPRLRNGRVSEIGFIEHLQTRTLTMLPQLSDQWVTARLRHSRIQDLNNDINSLHCFDRFSARRMVG